jgi:lipid A oxidase
MPHGGHKVKLLRSTIKNAGHFVADGTMTSNRRGWSPTLAVAVGWLAAAVAVCGAPAPSRAEVQISVYGGMNSNFSSRGELQGPADDKRTIDWEGKSFQMPPYWGAQVTYWFNRGASWGLAFDFTHAKAYADIDFASDPTYSHLEFTDGNNLAIINLMYRFDPVWGGKVVPFVGIGGGVAIPHVEVTIKPPNASDTFEYQFAGGAAQVLAGLEYKLDDAWSVFAMGKLSYSHLDTELSGGGKFKTYLWQPQLAIGLSYRFGN